MVERQRRTFTDEPLIRRSSPLRFGLFGPSGSGKTLSALLTAQGIQRVYGGEIMLADTEGGRGRDYADYVKARYIPFEPPHNPLDFVDLLEEYGRRQGVLVIDQLTEEHEGEEGLLETQAEIKREKGGEKASAVAWKLAKEQHNQLVRAIRYCRVPLVLCWRAKPKLDWKAQGGPRPMGIMPIGSEDLIFEMTSTLFLPPGTLEQRGIPCLEPKEIGEQLMTKVPTQFRSIFKPGQRLTPEHGEQMAWWAVGDDAPSHVLKARQIIREAKALSELEETAAIIRDAPKTKTLTGAEYRHLAGLLAEKERALKAQEGSSNV